MGEEMAELAEMVQIGSAHELRSQLWKPETWHPEALPSTAAIVKSVQETPETLEQLERYYGPEYARRLYAG